MPIRPRLTLWYGLLLGLSLLLFCVAFYLALQSALERDFDATLRVRALQIERELGSANQDVAELSPAAISQEALEPPTLGEAPEPGVYVQVLTRGGEILATSGTLLPVDRILVAQAVAGREAFVTLNLGGGQQLRTLYRPIRGRDHVIGLVQVAETLQLVQETMRDTRNLMLAGATVLMVAALVSGWVVTRRALAPVAAVTEAAHHIAETGRFNRRLALGAPRDELSALAATFDVMIDRIERTLRQQREFLADTSHELRTPLTVIRGNLDFVRRVTTDPASLESLREAEVEAVRMSRLINDLLMLAQEDAGQFLALREVPLDRLLQELGEQAQALTEDQRVEVEAAAEVSTLADPDRLRQAIWNLFQNAMRYTPAGGCITLALRTGAGEVALEVSDNGPGLQPGHEARIFERFYRIDPSRDRATGGAGLGLAIVRHIAEAHGGRVVLVNQPGQGATFRIVLPIRHAEESAPATGALRPRRATPASA
ncbi:MAG: HAMP domain-containing protein [Chloroflexi bacterium]|nr:HAMP domain-containing protein [Chloroflexota bacterium]